MPKQRDLKRIVRSRMTKTGEAYTAARVQVLQKRASAPDYAAIAGPSDAAVTKQTGRTWAEWVRVLDSARAVDKSHREIVAHVSSLGTSSWWSQSVTVGYERIRGLRDKGQRRGSTYEVSRSRTFAVPVKTLHDAFASARTRARWLPVKITVRSATARKTMRLTWTDRTDVHVHFHAKGEQKSTVVVSHLKLPDKAAADAMKQWWGDRLDRLTELLA